MCPYILEMLSRTAVVLLCIFAAPIGALAGPLDGWDGTWDDNYSGGSVVELPTFLEPARELLKAGVSYGTSFDADGLNSFWATQYSTETDATRPFEYLARLHAGEVAVVTYTMDQAMAGVMSGYLDDKLQKVFYEICRVGPVELRCLAMGWATVDDIAIKPLIDRIVQSFRVADPDEPPPMDVGL